MHAQLALMPIVQGLSIAICHSTAPTHRDPAHGAAAVAVAGSRAVPATRVTHGDDRVARATPRLAGGVAFIAHVAHQRHQLLVLQGSAQLLSQLTRGKPHR